MTELDPTLPERDPDAQMASAVGEALDADKLDQYLAQRAGQLGTAVTAYVRNESAARDTAAEAKETSEAWRSVESDLREKDEGVRTPRLRLVSQPQRYYRWAVAASLVLLALVTMITLSNLRSESEILIAEAGDSVQTVTLADGSQIVLRSHSVLYRTSDTETQSEYRLEGEATFDVVHNPERRFVVSGGSAAVSVLGTSFVLSTWGGETRVFLSEGKVELTSLGNSESVILQPGESSRVTKEGLVLAPIASDETAFRDWTTNRIVFNQELVGSVLAEFGHHYDVSLIAPDSLVNETVSGAIELSDFDTSLAFVGLLLGGKFVSDDVSERYVFTLDR